MLTEFYKNRNYISAIVEPLEGDGYVVFLDSRPRKNNIRQVLIAIHKNFICNKEIKLQILDDNEGKIYKVEEACPNYLRVDFSMNDIPISIIGTRIRIIDSRGPNEHKFRQTQLDNLLKKLPKGKKIIMVGDFNISDHENFKSKRTNWHYDDHYVNKLADFGMSVHIPKKGTSPIKSIYQMDHLILNNEYSKSVKCSYYPIKENECTWELKNNYPDHAMLLAEIDLTDTQI